MQAVPGPLILPEGTIGLDGTTVIPIKSVYLSNIGKLACFKYVKQMSLFYKRLNLNEDKIDNILAQMPAMINGRILPRGQTISIVELGKSLLRAAREGHTEQVRELMGKGAPFTTDWLGTSPLHYAALNNHLETCEILLRAGISRDARTKVERTPLHMAAFAGHLAIVQSLIMNGAEVDSKDMLKMTPLHWAVQNAHSDIVTFLLRSGAQPHTINKFDKTPIDIAIEINRLDIVQLLQVITKDPIVNMDQISNECPTDDVSMLEDAGKPEFLIDDDDNDDETCTEAENIEPPVAVIAQENTLNDIPDSLQILKDHGISFLPADTNSSVVASAVENGHSLVLTEVGKQVFNSTKPLVKMPVQKPIISKLKARKVIAVTAEQLLAMATSSKNMNIFRKVPANSINTAKPIKRLVMNKNRFILSPNVLKRQNDESSSNIEFVKRQLAEAKRQAEEYKHKLEEKEAEAERYKKQLQSMTQTK